MNTLLKIKRELRYGLWRIWRAIETIRGLTSDSDLTNAASIGQKNTVKRLIWAGAPLFSMRNHSLLFAAENGHTDIVALLLEAYANANLPINTVDQWGSTALHYAAKNGHTETVDLLLEAYANANLPINTVDQWGSTALHYAAKNGLTETVDLLVKEYLKANLSIHSKDTHQRTSLYWATDEGQKNTVALLAKAYQDNEVTLDDIDWQRPALDVAVEKGLKEIAKILIDAGASPLVRVGISHTPLGHAVEDGQLEMVKLLFNTTSVSKQQLLHGAVDTSIMSGCFSPSSPLHSAIKKGHIALIDFLIEEHKNADVPFDDPAAFSEKEGTYSWLYTAVLHLAINKHLNDVVEHLLRAGAPPLALQLNPILEKSSPLHCAAKHGNTELLKIFLNAGVTLPQVKDVSSTTLLHCAARGAHTETVKFLLSQREDIQAKDQWGRTPLHSAASGGHIEIVKLFHNHDERSLHTQDNGGATPLHYAAWLHNTETVEFLLEVGTSLLVTDHNGKTPLLYATEFSPQQTFSYEPIDSEKHRRKQTDFLMNILRQRPEITSAEIKKLMLTSPLSAESDQNFCKVIIERNEAMSKAKNSTEASKVFATYEDKLREFNLGDSVDTEEVSKNGRSDSSFWSNTTELVETDEFISNDQDRGATNIQI